MGRYRPTGGRCRIGTLHEALIQQVRLPPMFGADQCDFCFYLLSLFDWRSVTPYCQFRQYEGTGASDKETDCQVHN